MVFLWVKGGPAYVTGKNIFGKKSQSRGKKRIGDINLMTDVLNKICGMSLENYINNFTPDMPYRCAKEIIDILGIDSYEGAYIPFGEVCRRIRQKYEEVPEGSAPDRQLLKVMAYLVPIPQRKKEEL